MFSVIMPSYLGEYPSCAQDRHAKFLRAVDSVMSQSFMDWELRIVSDGCDDTVELAKRFAGSARVRISKIPKQNLWSGVPRNTGIKEATGDWIIYLDTDDMWGPEHLSIVSRGLKEGVVKDWAYFNDWYWDGEAFKERLCDINRYGKHGTSNIVHRRDLVAWWPQSKGANYAHDRHFIAELKSKGAGVRIGTPRYFVCHDVERVNDAARPVPVLKSKFDV